MTKDAFPQRETLILFARPPVPGRVKTRLIPRLGREGAAALYRGFLLDATALAAEVRRRRPSVGLAAEWALDGEAPPEGAFSQWLTGPFLHRPQRGVDLGERMAAATGSRLAWGGSAILIGTDFPDLAPEILIEAFGALEEMGRSGGKAGDAVIGPAGDGGYYLIGLTRPIPALFTGVGWGKPGVFEATMLKLASLSFAVHVLPEWHDVDEPADLDALLARLAERPETVARHTRKALRSQMERER